MEDEATAASKRRPGVPAPPRRDPAGDPGHGASLDRSGAGADRGDDALPDALPDAPADVRDLQFAAFVHSAGPYLLHTAELLCGDRARAQDLVQTTFERTYRSWRRVHDDDPWAYARRILVNLRIDTWRRTRREILSAPDRLPDGLPDQAAPDHAPAVTGRAQVVAALARLPLAQRRVVVLRHLLDLTEPQVARELGISVGTVKSHNARALQRLRELLKEDHA